VFDCDYYRQFRSYSDRLKLREIRALLSQTHRLQGHVIETTAGGKKLEATSENTFSCRKTATWLPQFLAIRLLPDNSAPSQPQNTTYLTALAILLSALKTDSHDGFEMFSRVLCLFLFCTSFLAGIHDFPG